MHSLEAMAYLNGMACIPRLEHPSYTGLPT